MENLIMSESGLNDIVCRLIACRASLSLVHANLRDDEPCVDAVFAVCDHLQSILTDFQADIKAAVCHAEVCA